MNGKTATLQIDLQIMWSRLISLVEEQAQALVRTAFSPIVRESGDLSAGIFDVEGQMLAQAVTGTPGHVNSMAASVRFFLEAYPAETMQDGDVFITNDPWMGTGHLHDMVVVTPCFWQGKLIALFASTSHMIDVGGIGFGPDGRDVFEEGFYIPILPLVKQGIVDHSLLAMVRGNSRYPVEIEGDILSLAACNDVGIGRLRDMVKEFALSDLNQLGSYIIETSQTAMLKEIHALPKGRFSAQMRVDGYENPLDLVASVTISDSGIDVDFTGTSGPSVKGINVPLTYAQAYANYGVRVLIGPEVPNNAGSIGLVRVTAPEGCIVNAKRPAPVSSRHIIGQMLPDVVFGCLRQVPGLKAPAEGSSCLWNLILENHSLRTDQDGKIATQFSVLTVQTGGAGARRSLDGLSTTAFPSGVSGVPVEIVETISPLRFRRKELRSGSGGDGKFRGGLGQIIEIENRENTDFELYAALDRIVYAPRGAEGGGNGATGVVALGSGTKLKGKGRQTIPAGDWLVVHTPGGAGFGNPAERDAGLVELDRLYGLSE
jgi:N-methylhydantoinase B